MQHAVKKEFTCRELVEKILRRGRRMRNRQIGDAIAEAYGIQFQDNTIAKNLSFLINDGLVQSEKVQTINGVYCDEYWYVFKAADQSVPGQELVQADQPCSGCGSMYRRGDRCNKCGQVKPVPRTFFNGAVTPYTHVGRFPRGLGWNTKQHKAVYR